MSTQTDDIDEMKGDDSFEPFAQVRRGFEVIRRRKRLLMLVVFACVFCAGAYLATAVPTYLANGRVQVSSGSSGVGASALLDLSALGVGSDVYTEAEIIRSKGFITDVLKAERYNVRDPRQPRGVSMRMDVTLFGGTPVDDRLRAVRSSIASAEVYSEDVDLVEFELDRDGADVVLRSESGSWVIQPGILVSNENFAIQFSEAPVSELPAGFQFNVVADWLLYDIYKDQIGVVPLGTARQPTNIVEVQVASSDRGDARLIAQRLLEHYVELHLRWQAQSASQASGFISLQLEELSVRLKRAEDALLSFVEEEGAVELEAQAEATIETLAELQVQRLRVDMEEKTLASVRRSLSRTGGDGSRTSATANFFEDPVLAERFAALAERETRLATLSATFTEAHPSVVAAREAVAKQRTELSRLVKSAEGQLGKQRRKLDEQLEGLNAELEGFPEKQLEMARLSREMRVATQLYELLLEKREEAEILKASTTTDKRIVDPAGLPFGRAKPKRVRTLVASFVLGLAAGIVLCLVVERFQNTLGSVDSIVDEASLPVYGRVPDAEVGLVKDGTRLQLERVWEDPNGRLPEAMRSVAVGLSLLPRTGGGAKVICVTSSQPGEGKSTVLGNLAIALSRMGKDVFLLDLDLRRPVQHRQFRLKRSPGYAEYLASDDDLKHLVQVGECAGASVRFVGAGSRMVDTVPAIVSPGLDRLLSEVRSEHDYVLVDAPPAFVPETTAIVSACDLVLLVAQPGIVRRANLRHAVDLIRRSGKQVGLVLNGIKSEHVSDYYGGEYYYAGGAAYYDQESA